MQSAKTQPFTYDEGGDAIDLLRGQHREIEQLFGALERAQATDDKTRILAELGDLLAVHMAVEERVFYPGLTPGRREGDDDRGFVVLAVEDHFGLKRRLAGLLDLDVADDGFDAAAAALRGELAAHTPAEERQFPRIRRRLPRA
ncbi:MAG TPA: hemerythrin domain-containing protein, partial [Polyangia bacterium]|nr:hemerythrin domain-containing protein [Polyangia bacterium]